VEANGKILVSYERGLARLNSDGSLDEEFGTGAYFIGGQLTSVGAALQQPDGAYLFVGDFSIGAEQTRTYLARFYPTSQLVPPFLTNLARTPEGYFTGSIFTAPGFHYRLDVASRLPLASSSTNWMLLTNLVGNGGFLPFSDATSIGQPIRFYRWVLP
jgi:hypothetical protein